MKFESLKALMDHYTNIEVDRAFVKKVLAFVQEFANKNEQHTQFFGTPYLGCYRAVWGDQYQSQYWLEEICGIYDVDEAQDDIYELKDIDRNWKVASNITNLTFLYVAHRLHTSTLNAKDKEVAIVYTIIAAHMKHLTSGMRRRFPYQANQAISMAHYEALSYKSDLKKAGSWFDLLRDRGEQVLQPKFIRRVQLETFEGTYDIVRWANDLQDRLVDLLNTLTESFHRVKEQEAKISHFSRLSEIEGVKVVGSYRNAQRELRDALSNKLRTKPDLIKESLVEMTDNLVNTLDERYLRQTLDYIVENNREIQPDLNTLADTLVVSLFDVAREEGLELTDPGGLVAKMLFLYRSSQTRRDDIKTVKVVCQTLIEEAIPRARPAIKTSTSVGLFVYLLLRIFTLRQ